MLPRYDSQFHRSVSLFIEPEKSSTIATSRGRWAAVAVAWTLSEVRPKIREKKLEMLGVTVTWVRL